MATKVKRIMTQPIVSFPSGWLDCQLSHSFTQCSPS